MAEEKQIESLLAEVKKKLLSESNPSNMLQWLHEYASEQKNAVCENPVLQRRMSVSRPSHYQPRSAHLLEVSQYNQGTAFTKEEREKLGLEGLLPAKIETLDEQVARAFFMFSSQTTQLNKFLYLDALKETNHTLFFKLVLNNLSETLPIVYTPTVGEACMKFGQIFSHAQGMYISAKAHRGHVRQVLDNWTSKVDIIVVTDGSRILGLGDLGSNGMGIPIGKLALYTAAIGFHPARTLPIQLDTGCNRKEIVENEFYLGERMPRIPDEEYYPFLEEFLMAIKDKWPDCLLQFEDFSNDHCFSLLEKYRNRMRCFNDDIQGTGAVIAAGFVSACRLSGVPLNKQTILFFGAGSAAIGVAEQLMQLMIASGMTTEEAQNAFYLVDSKGLVTSNRGDTLQAHKVPWARKDQTRQYQSLVEIVATFKPTTMIGLSGTPQVFTEEVVKEMYKVAKRPIIFPLSNPTTKAECTAEQAYTWTNGDALVASGSPFDPVEFNGKVLTPGQGNNMYIFPGLGMGAFLSQAKCVSDEMVIAAALALVECVTPEMLEKGSMYPPVSMIRKVSLHVAVRVMEKVLEQKLNGIDYPPNLEAFVEQNMWVPGYFEA